jgi:hypothetical protein
MQNKRNELIDLIGEYGLANAELAEAGSKGRAEAMCLATVKMCAKLNNVVKFLDANFEPKK